MKTLPAAARWIPLLAVAGRLAAPPAAAATPAPTMPKVAPAVIDAARYPSLQAAFDALPASGGLVRLPPGEFELEQRAGRQRIVITGNVMTDLHRLRDEHMDTTIQTRPHVCFRDGLASLRRSDPRLPVRPHTLATVA